MGQELDTAQARVILVIGGARSGKSTFAEHLARRSHHSVAFIATATAGDLEMHERIKRHRQVRPDHWTTIEEPLLLCEAIREGVRCADMLILDCMTLWLSNWISAQVDIDQLETCALSSQYCEQAICEIDDMLSVFEQQGMGKTLVVVTNEVGFGLVPPNHLGRLYRDVLGCINQRLATYAHHVYLMVAGLGVDIRCLHENVTL